MTNLDDIPPERLVRSTAEDAEAWAQSPEGRAEMERLAKMSDEMSDEDIDFSDIPELTGDPASRVERLLDEVGDDPATLLTVLDAVTRRLRAATTRKAG